MKTLDSANLPENERRAIEEAARTLKSELPVTRVILFGSKARGDAQPDSDIDLLVLTSCPATTELRRAVSGRLFEINLREDVGLSSVVVAEDEWSSGLVQYLLIHSDVEKDGCAV